MNVLVYVFCWTYLLISVEYMSKRWIAGSQDIHMLSFSRYQFTLPRTVCESSNCSISLPTLCIFCLFNLAILVGMQWYYTVVLFCIILMTDEVEHLFMCLLAVWRSSFMKFLFRSFAHFSTVLSVFFLLSQYFIDFSYFTDCSYFQICEYHLLLEAFLFSMISNLAIPKHVT